MCWQILNFRNCHNTNVSAPAIFQVQEEMLAFCLQLAHQCKMKQRSVHSSKILKWSAPSTTALCSNMC